MLGAATGLVLGAAAGAAAAGCCSCWCYRWCYTGVFRARRFVASVPLDMMIWKEVQVLRNFFPCCKSSVPCCSMMQSHLNYFKKGYLVRGGCDLCSIVFCMSLSFGVWIILLF